MDFNPLISLLFQKNKSLILLSNLIEQKENKPTNV